MPEASSVTALLGPTNTGKTHRAIERMLEHDTGMIGLPLRLLAREVYDRVTARVGEARVALVTGEEKRVPPRPDYWVCTVEAMPVDREVDFLAVDEIQLCAHPQRGHVFTERLLSARGRKETMFLGADTMHEAVRELLPVARIERHPRLSRLSFAGAGKLSRVPPRSAVVAFSTAEVYEVAERMKALHGGTAVVLGALSPRTRNAQVAMFQAGEVDRMVATDAIGMGLNLDVRHVAFSSLRKFDGRDVRGLDPAEVAQIAGRAGRYQNDGSFGSVAPLRIAPELALDVEEHRFAPVRRLVWRNSELDFSSVETLLASLRARPRSRWLRLVEDPDDTAALAELAQMSAVRARAQGPAAVKLLWDVCTVPDFRKLLLGVHVELLAELYEQLAGPRGALDEDWMAARVAEIDDVRGDVDTLMGRVAAVRTFTYVSHRAGWIARAREWQERTRDVEDRLSDALHEALVQRFVDRSRPRPAPTAAPRARTRNVPATSNALEPAASSPAHPFAALAQMRAALSPAGETPPDEDSPARWVESLVGAAHAEFELDERGRIAFRGRAVGQLVRGSRLVLPDVKPLDLGDLGAGARARVLRRLVAWARDVVGELLAELRAPTLRELSPAGTRVLYLLEQGLGTAAGPEARAALRALGPVDRTRMREAGVEAGRLLAHLPGALTAESVTQRAVLCAAYFGWRESARAPAGAPPSVPVDKRAEPDAYAAMGYPVFGTRAVRADVAERAAEALRAGGAGAEVGALAGLMGCDEAEVPWVVDALAEG